MCKPLIGALNGTSVCLFLKRGNVLEDVEEALGRGGRGGATACEYAGGLSAGSDLGKDLSVRGQKLHHCMAERGWTYRFVKGIALGWKNHGLGRRVLDLFGGSDLTRTMLETKQRLSLVPCVRYRVSLYMCPEAQKLRRPAVLRNTQ